MVGLLLAGEHTAKLPSVVQMKSAASIVMVADADVHRFNLFMHWYHTRYIRSGAARASLELYSVQIHVKGNFHHRPCQSNRSRSGSYDVKWVWTLMDELFWIVGLSGLERNEQLNERKIPRTLRIYLLFGKNGYSYTLDIFFYSRPIPCII